MLDENPYPTGTQISDAQIKDLEDRALTRHGFHGEWNYTFPPVPRPAPPPEPEPARPGHGILNHPALTGMTPADLNALAAALDLPFRARREQHLYTRRGRGRVNAEAAVPPPRKIDLTGHVLATRLRQHLHLPLKVIGALPGVDFTTVSHAVSLTTSLLAGQDQPPAAPPPGIRLRTLDDLRDYAAGHGITIPRPAEPPPHRMTQ